MSTKTPNLAIGLPVYNGQRFVSAAIESILAQSLGDYRLVISDNASTDQTEAICREYARRDSRIIYNRSPTNLGAAPNFNRVLKLSEPLGVRYFKWAAADDLIEPNFLQQCMTALQADPEAVLAHTRASIIDIAGRELIPRDATPEYLASVKAGGRATVEAPKLTMLEICDPPRRTGSPDVATRLHDIFVRTRWCFEQFGVIRTDCLRRSPLHLGFYGSDKVLMVALALQGRFIELPDRLFMRRHHEEQSSSKSYKDLALWMDATRGVRRPPPQVECLRWYLKLIGKSHYSAATKMRCYGKVGRWAAWLAKLIYTERNERGFLHRAKTMLTKSMAG
jgi:glycosyltransferase involved in cell wall biosynthesis